MKPKTKTALYFTHAGGALAHDGEDGIRSMIFARDRKTAKDVVEWAQRVSHLKVSIADIAATEGDQVGHFVKRAFKRYGEKITFALITKAAYPDGTVTHVIIVESIDGDAVLGSRWPIPKRIRKRGSENEGY
jgi:hypothetical protein